MKSIDFFCTSQASTAICLSMDQVVSSSSSNTIQLGSRVIDRHNPIIRDSRRFSSRAYTTQCSSPQPPIHPKPYPQHQKTKESSSSKPTDQNKKNSTKGHHHKTKSTAGKLTENITNSYSSSNPINSILRRSWIRPPANLITPPGSSRYFLSDAAFLNGLSDSNPVLSVTSIDNSKAQVAQKGETNPASSNLSSPACPRSGSSDQVVELRVSLHCKACERKVRKHLSRMEGVSSFNIDFEAKKVTIVGDVTQTSALASVSKVKNAQFWPVSDQQLDLASHKQRRKL